jgi:chitinase
MIKNALNHGYNVFVYAFGGQNANNQPYLKFSQGVKNTLAEQLSVIHNHAALALMSVGGGSNNTFNPSLNGNAVQAGQKMGEFLAQNGFDGFDIDVEHPNASTTESNLLTYIQAMRNAFKVKTGKDLILTAAPQISGWYGKGEWASGSAEFAEPMYTQSFVNKAHFNAFFVQTYNQYGGAQFGGLNGFDKGFLTYSFKLLSQETRDIMKGVPSTSFVVPKETKIVLGVPDFKDPKVTEAQYRQGACLADATCSGAGLYKPSDIISDIHQGNLDSYDQFGGLMTWILNSDAYQNWSWVDGVKNY